MILLFEFLIDDCRLPICGTQSALASNKKRSQTLNSAIKNQKSSIPNAGGVA